MRVLNTEQMREADRRTIDDIGIPSIVLMENAGRQAVAAMEAAFEDLATSRVGVLCGRGNNGGDGFVVARTLVQRGVEAAVFLLGSVADVRGDARTNLEILGRIGLTVVEITNAQEWELHFSELSECELIVDAILGTGFRGPLTGLLETVVADVNGLGVPVVAIDLPTGVSADSAAVEGTAIEASMTVTLAAPKIPLIFPPADTHAGDLGDRRHRHSAAADRRARRAASRAADARAHARDRPGARAPTRTRATSAACSSSPDRSAAPAPRISRRSARCAPAPAW